jgi:hypothetical protein
MTLDARADSRSSDPQVPGAADRKRNGQATLAGAQEGCDLQIANVRNTRIARQL